MEGRDCERGDDLCPSAQALAGCGGSRQQSPVEEDLLGKVVERWDVPGRWRWAEEGEVGWNRRCANHLWVGHGWHCSLVEAEEGRSSRVVARRCWHRRLGAHPEDLVLREAGHPLLVPVSIAPAAE